MNIYMIIFSSMLKELKENKRIEEVKKKNSHAKCLGFNILILELLFLFDNFYENTLCIYACIIFQAMLLLTYDKYEILVEK